MTVFLDRQASRGTTDGGRRRATKTLRHRRQRLALLLISSLLRIVTCDFLQICKIAVWKSFGFFLLFIEIFVSVGGSLVQFWRIFVSRVCIFCQGNLCFVDYQFDFLVQFFGSRVCVVLLPTAIILRV